MTEAFITGLLVAFYIICGIGTITIIRKNNELFPKIFGLWWPALLLMAALGCFD